MDADAVALLGMKEMAEAIWKEWPRKEKEAESKKAVFIALRGSKVSREELAKAAATYIEATSTWPEEKSEFLLTLAGFCYGQRWRDDPKTWFRNSRRRTGLSNYGQSSGGLDTPGGVESKGRGIKNLDTFL